MGSLTVVTCISLWEPWATLMAMGLKRNETRSWPTRHRGDLLICASKRRDLRELGALLDIPAFRSALVRPGDVRLGNVVDRLNFGHAVALVRLASCIETERVPDSAMHGDEREFGDYTPGRFAWVTTDLRPLQPFPITGHQGLWQQAIDPARLVPLESQAQQEGATQ